MTVLRDDAALCTCWRDATQVERDAEYRNRNQTLGPRGLRSCKFCHGAGWWVDEPACTVSNIHASTGWLVTTYRGRWAYQAWHWGEAETGFASDAPAAEQDAKRAHERLAVLPEIRR